MRPGYFPLLVVCVVCLFSALTIRTQTVNEAESGIILNETTADISLILENPNKGSDGKIEIEILDPKNIVRAQITQNVYIKKGRETYKLSVPLGDLAKTAKDEIAFYRLRYRINDKTGIISLSELIRDIFELSAAASENVLPGMNYRVRVQAVHPFTKQPVKTVEIEGELKLDIGSPANENELTIKAKGNTDAEGFVVLEFRIPADIKSDDGDLRVTGRKNGITREIDETLNIEEGTVFLTTDKPIYQPGQSFSIRGLYLDAGNNVVPDKEMVFKIYDEENTVLYRETIKTSAFGIASIAWQIPENARLGSYRILVDTDALLREDQLYFKVSRYDLPNFAVAAKPDKNFYLPTDQQAEISVTANYLFGKPLTKGKVRLVQADDWSWNYKEQKYDINENQVFEGITDPEGKYVIKVDLNTEMKDLLESSTKRYQDLHFAAYYTDLTTNKTEQKRFDVRLTKEPIHVYLIGRNVRQNPNLPVTYYVSTFYADGSPAACNVSISGKYKNKPKIENFTGFKTNAFGAGKLEFKLSYERIDDDFQMKIAARDKTGQTGTFEEKIHPEEEDSLKIETDKTIYKPGEDVQINLTSTKKEAFVYIDIAQNTSVIESRFVNLEDGKGNFSIPYNTNFKGNLTVAAYIDSGKKEEYYHSYNLIQSSRGIIFPEQQNLTLATTFSGDNLKPNEEAKVKFSVHDGAGKTVESALGIVVFDKAVEERAQTDAEFDGYLSPFYRLLGYSESFGQITLKDLNDLNLSKPISADLQLAAEIMLSDNYYYPQIYHSGEKPAKSVYAEIFNKQLPAIETALKKQFTENYEHPTNEKSLREILKGHEINFDELRDPWEQNYRPVFTVEKSRDIFTLQTAGPDKKFGTKDDFNVLSLGFDYFLPTGKTIDKVNLEYHRKNPGFIRNYETLRDELRNQNVDLDSLHDPWNKSYLIEFGVNQRKFTITFHSSGMNGTYEPNKRNAADFDIWTSEIDYFAETETRIQNALNSYINENKIYPSSEESFKNILRTNKIDFSQIKDGFGRNVYLTATTYSRYSNKVKIENRAKYGGNTSQKTIIDPVTQQVIVYKISSSGADGKQSTSDDFDLTVFSGVISEQGKSDAKSKTQTPIIILSGIGGAISGIVKDPNGAVIPDTYVTAINIETGNEFLATTNKDGIYIFKNLPFGKYTITAIAPGFSATIIEDVPILSQAMTEVNISLSVAAAIVNVEVTAQGVTTIESTSSTVSRENKLLRLAGSNSALEVKEKASRNKPLTENSTPRLREYFPETLVWNPELLTDKSGKAELKFKLADNITTWKLYAIASTKNGRIGTSEKEFTAFQPFFVDLEPPKFLTEGDEISLPVQIRNYTNTKQKVDITMTKTGWFSFLNAEKQPVEIAPNDSQNAVFGFKAISIIKDGKQRVTAVAGKNSDAIEKPVTVRPNGREIVKTDSIMFRETGTFDINFPQNALPKTQKAELKIYPNLFSHVTDSVNGLLQRPYGCGEQTISSTYPNLMILKFTKADSKIRQAAQKYLQKGYERLLGYQVADGGFSYWGGKDASDPALTAYALRFLSDAKDFIDVDEDVLKKAKNWLINQQRADGSWSRKYYWENSENESRTKLFTSYAARTLSMIRKENRVPSKAENEEAALQKALSYLKAKSDEIDEPYAMALFGLAALDAGDISDARLIVERLEKMAIPEAGGVYWKLETNTPFYGWGTAGRLETTALVIQLLTKFQIKQDKIKTEIQNRNTGDLISKGIIFLLKNKDRYGVWYSTQTTINVLDAFLAVLAEESTPEKMPDHVIEVLLNGVSLQNITISSGRIEPVIFDLTGKLKAASNQIQIRSSDNSPVMSQIITTHYIDWKDSQTSDQTMNQSRGLRLDYKCDRQAAAIMQDINCSVEAERIGFQGYGMLLAEIGIPPGADISRESLESAMDKDWSLSRYDILSDRIILYMWAKAGGTKFNFSFRPRYGINAQTPASIIYDYYNPEAQAMIAPMKFRVR